jgi:hypothetical protein
MPPSVQRFFFARAPAGRSPIGNVWRFTGKRSDFYGVVPAAWRPAVVDENGRMETAARASEILALDIGDLDLRNRRAKVRRKGSAIDVVVWQTSTARLLPRLLTGRSGGPVFCTDRRARLPVAPIDVDTATGRAPTVLPPCRATLRAGHDRDHRRVMDASPAASLRAHARGGGRREHFHPAVILRPYLDRLPRPVCPRLTRRPRPLAATTRSRYPTLTW